MASTHVHLSWLLTGVRQSSPGSTPTAKFGVARDTLSMVYVYLGTFIAFAPWLQGDKQGVINENTQPSFFLEQIMSKVL